MTFADHVFGSAVDAVRSLPAGDRTDVYVVSFFIYDEEDDPRRPTLTIGTNTETQVRLASDPPPDFRKPNPWWEPTDEAEARWNYASWQQNRLAVIADTGVDPVGAAFREAWVREPRLWVDEPNNDDWADFEEMGTRITHGFVRLCVATAQKIHAANVLTELFGHPLPIVIHELEYDDQTAAQNEEANPPGLTAEFSAWIASM